MPLPFKHTCPLCGIHKVGLADHLRAKHGVLGFQPAPLPVAPPKKRQASPTGRQLRCPDCDGWMVLRPGRYGFFYGCQNYPACPGAHGAHPDGQPMGIPADKDTRKLRQAAHMALEATWEPGPKQRFPSRGAAYEWVQATMGMTADEAHIAKFDAVQCRKVIEALWAFDEDVPLTSS